MRVFGHWELLPSAPSIPYQDPTLPRGTIVRRLCLSILEATDLIVINQGSPDPNRGWILCQKGTICTNLPVAPDSAVITLCEITANRSHAAFAPNNRNVSLNDKNPSNARSECCGSSKP